MICCGLNRIIAPSHADPAEMTLLTSIQCADIFALVARQLNNRELLKLSMCCRATRDAVDSSAERLSQGLYVANWNSTGANLKVREYPNEIILHIDCDLLQSLRYKIMTSVTGQVGEVLEMGISVKGMHKLLVFC